MNLKQYFKKAQKERFAIGQFNFSTLEQVKGIALAAFNLKSPIILGTSEGEAGYFGIEEAAALVKAVSKKMNISVFLNLDHGKSEEIIIKAIKAGYSMVHFDGSSFPIEENIRICRKLASIAHRRGVVFEGELGAIKGESIPHSGSPAIEQSDLTSPEDVNSFVKKSKVDCLAVSIGSAHGVYEERKNLDIERLKKISEKTKAYLVLHGGSGISEPEIKEAIASGIRKININTELRIAWRKEMDNILELNKGEVKPYKMLPSVIEKIREKAEEKIKIFGSEGKA